uniref:Caffeoyl-CoA O-methyltransferase n=2 Tax=Triticinae TaxID=1648030 RepID=A0A453L325_AEGTS
PVVEKAGMAHKVDFRVGLALPVLDQLVAEVRAPRVPLPPSVLAPLCCMQQRDDREFMAWPLQDGNLGKFDFAFVDADKANFHHYHERLLRLVRVGGLIAYDNTLWGGSVAAPDDEALSERDRELAGIARAFNAALTADRRVQVCQLAISDGIMLCRRVA